MTPLSPLRLGQLRQLRRLAPATARLAFAALAAGEVARADDLIRLGMQDALSRLGSQPAEAPVSEPALGPVLPRDMTPGESVAAMLGADITAERQRQAVQKISRPDKEQSERMYKLALGAGGGSGLNVHRWKFGR